MENDPNTRHKEMRQNISMQTFILSQIGQKASYHLMTGSIVPRPIALISTINLKGIINLAPFSFFNGVSSAPPTLMISFTGQEDSPKDTLRNILESKQFVVNSVTESILSQANQCAAEYPYGISEMEKVGLTPLPSQMISPPRVSESPIQMECELLKTLQVGKGIGSATLVVGKILVIHVADPIFKNGKIDPRSLKPVGRLGGSNYSPLGEIIHRPYPKL